MKNVKRILLALVVLALSVSCLVMSASADELASGEKLDNGQVRYRWSLSDDYVLTITGTGEVVTEFNKWCIPYDITDVVISEGITGLGNDIFKSRSDIKNVSLPSTLKTIGTNAFSACISLRKIVIPEGVTSVGASAFSSTDLRSVTLPSTLE